MTNNKAQEHSKSKLLLTPIFVAQKNAKILDDDSIYSKIELALLISPEFNTMWNYRKEMLLFRLERATDEAAKLALLEADLSLTQRVLEE